MTKLTLKFILNQRLLQCPTGKERGVDQKQSPEVFYKKRVVKKWGCSQNSQEDTCVGLSFC